MKTRDFLIIGHPRGGTAYSSRLFKTFGFDVGHESVCSTGISSWCFVTPDGWNVWTDKEKRKQYEFKWTFLAIRNPLNVISSLVRENNSNSQSLYYFEKWAGYKLTEENEINRAVQRYLQWEDTIEYWNDYIDFTFRVEDQQKDLFDHLRFIGYDPYYHLGEEHISEHIVKRNINTRPKTKILTLEDIDGKYREKVKEKMIKYGYSLES